MNTYEVPFFASAAVDFDLEDGVDHRCVRYEVDNICT
jgi:hypothetical protein